MAATSQSKVGAKRNTKVQLQHVILFGIIFLAFFGLFQFRVIPWGVSQFVVPLFKPNGEKLEKLAFVKFNGLVWASTTKEKEKAILAAGSAEVKKDLINRDYIFDFTMNERTMDQNGYVKASNEFYVKSEVLGENAIILEPWIGFIILAIVLSVLFTIFVTILLPPGIGFMSLLFDRQIENTKSKIRLQTGFSDEVVDLLCMPDDKLREKDYNEVYRIFRVVWDRTQADEIASSRQSLRFEDNFQETTDIVMFRNYVMYERIKEFFSDFVEKEIVDTKDGLIWRRNRMHVMKGIRLYLTHHFTEKYSNNVTGLAYGGAAFLIVAVGIRGLKFIPAAKPSFILLAIFLEFSMLSLLAITLIYTEEEERMDKMLKKMEDANRSQLETLRGQQYDIHQLSNALIGQNAEIIKARVESAVSEFMSSDDNMKKTIAQEIGDKIFKGLKDVYFDKDNSKYLK